MEQGNDIGKLALVGDVWYQIINIHTENGSTEYLLYTKDYWVPKSWIKEIKEKYSFINGKKIMNNEQ